MTKDQQQGFFAQSYGNRIAMIPAVANMATYDGSTGASGNEVAAYRSRVKASRTNGAQAVANNVKSPWSTIDYMTGTSSLANTSTSTNSTKKRWR